MSSAGSTSPLPSRLAEWPVWSLLALALALALFAPRFKGLGIAAPIAWLVVERLLRRRPAGGLAFRGRTFLADLRAQAWLVLLVGVVFQAVALLGARALLPAFVEHVVARLPLDLATRWVALLPALLLAILGEEIVFRGFFQARLAAKLGAPAAIGLVSLVFAAMHFTPGPPAAVALDLALIAIDSVVYGLLFARSRSLLVAWTGHALADVTGLALLLAMR